MSEFNANHPYPDIYYDEEGELEPYCDCCENIEDECECTRYCCDGFHWSLWDEAKEEERLDRFFAAC